MDIIPLSVALPMLFSIVSGLIWLAFKYPKSYDRLFYILFFALLIFTISYGAYITGKEEWLRITLAEIDKGVSPNKIELMHSGWPLIISFGSLFILFMIPIIVQYIDLDGEKSETDKKSD